MTKPQASINPVWVTKQRAVNNPAAGHHGPIRVDRRRCGRVGVVPDRRFPLEGKPAGFGVFFIGINGHGRPRQQSMSREGKFGGAIGLVHQPPRWPASDPVCSKLGWWWAQPDARSRLSVPERTLRFYRPLTAVAVQLELLPGEERRWAGPWWDQVAAGPASMLTEWWEVRFP